MKPFRQHVAIAVDGGGIKGVIVTRALAILEEHLGTGDQGQPSATPIVEGREYGRKRSRIP